MSNPSEWKKHKWRTTTFAMTEWQFDFMEQLVAEKKFCSKSEFLRFLISMYHRDIVRTQKEDEGP